MYWTVLYCTAQWKWAISLRKCNSKVTWMGGMSGRQGKFSGLVTDGMSSMGPTTGLVGPRWMWALAILALVGLVGLAALMLCSDATGKGPACPGLECYEEGKKGKGVIKWQKYFHTAGKFTCLWMWNMLLFILVLCKRQEKCLINTNFFLNQK